MIRKMEYDDIEKIYNEFIMQGWSKEKEILSMYYDQQNKNERYVFIAFNNNGDVLGYATVLNNESHGPFKDKNIPVICDFNVFIKYQGQGIGNEIMEACENFVKGYSDKICLGVGLHKGYGAAQRMYIKRGYIPDGSGVWYNNENLPQNENCVNDDDLVLYLCKEFK